MLLTSPTTYGSWSLTRLYSPRGEYAFCCHPLSWIFPSLPTTREAPSYRVFPNQCHQSTVTSLPRILHTRGSIPAKVGFWVGLRIFSYVPTPTNLTNAISKTQLSGPTKGVFWPKIPRKCPFFCFWRVLAGFSGLKPAEWALHHFFVSLMLHIGEKKVTTRVRER